MDICLSLKNAKPKEIELCHALLAEGFDVDVGTTSIDYSNNHSLPKYVGANDGYLDRSELIRSALTIKKPNERIQILLKNLIDMRMPWWPESVLLGKWQTWVGKKDAEIAKEHEPSSVEYNATMATDIYNWMTQRKSEGGLGIVYKMHSEDEANADLVYERGYATCSEFLYEYYGIAILSGLEIYLLEVPIPAIDNDIVHLAAMVNVGDGKFLYVDPEKGVSEQFFYNTYFVSDATTLMVAYLRGVCTEESSDRDLLREIRYDKTCPIRNLEDVAPRSALAMFSLGYYFLKGEKYTEASRYAKRAKSLWPEFGIAEKLLNFSSRHINRK